MSKDEALRMALEALENLINQHYAETTTNDDLEMADKAITAIKEALAQPEQEPVAWRFRTATQWLREPHWRYLNTLEGSEGLLGIQPLYITPPQRKPLTDEQRNWIVATCPTPRHIIDTVEKMHGIKE